MIHQLLLFLQSLPVDVTSFMMLVICVGLLLGMLSLFGEAGVVVYICIAVVAANIQVLKLVSYPWMPEPVAFGTVVYSTTFLATDMLAEFYGRKQANRSILLGFSACVLMTVMMFLTLGVKPLGLSGAASEVLGDNHAHMVALFLPAPGILIASLTAYGISQYLDVAVFTMLSKLLERRFLGVRTNIATLLAAFIDNALFSILAFIILAPQPLPWDVVLKTYILSTFVMRGVIAILCTPGMYLARYCVSRYSLSDKNVFKF